MTLSQVQWVGPQCVIVVFSDHTHSFFKGDDNIHIANVEEDLSYGRDVGEVGDNNL